MAEIENTQALMFSASSVNGEVKTSFRIAHVLKPSIPSSSNQTQIFNFAPIPSPTKPISPILNTLSSKTKFNGWNYPLKKWNSWVDRLRPKFESKWRQASIFEAIMCSTLRIPKCSPSVFAIAEKWCPCTNTFVLPWGEVTVTLEDVLVLGGFSVTGAPVSSQLYYQSWLQIEKNLCMEWSELFKSSTMNGSHQIWLEKWMGTGREAEHEAFLALWLSRYVFPANDVSLINKSTFQIAVLLAKGIRIALAPAVLASVYRDLRILRENLAATRVLAEHHMDMNDSKVVLWAPLQLLQVWFWERFPKLSPNFNFARGLCVLERWHDVTVIRNNDVDVGVDIDSAGAIFKWRPYSTPMNGWLFDFDMVSYGRFIRVSKLEGLDCVERYFPHRVAMQFGLDQDVPIGPFGLNDNAFDPLIGDTDQLYMPPKNCEPGITANYLSWWRMSIWVVAMMRIIIQNSAEVPPGFSPNPPNDEAEVPPGFNPNPPNNEA